LTAETNAAGLTDPDPATDTPETAPEATEGNPANREAARYRRQLRDTQAELEAARGEVTKLRTAAAEAVLADVLAKPSALWLAGYDVADFYDDQGSLDVESLRDAAKTAVEEKGLGGFRRFQGSADGGARGESGAKPAPSWQNLFGRD